MNSRLADVVLDVFVSSVNKFGCLFEGTFQLLVDLEEIPMFVKCVSNSWQSLVICCYKQELISFLLWFVFVRKEIRSFFGRSLLKLA